MATMAKEVLRPTLTKVRLNSPESQSVETTIPEWIAALMDLGGDDFLEWEYDQNKKTAVFFKTDKRPPKRSKKPKS